MGRKRAQEDVKLLANRIALLKAEEKKAWKKIEETKKKATDVQKVKFRNNEKEREKADRENKKARDREL